LWTSTIPLIWICGRPNSQIREVGDMTLEITTAQSVQNQNRLSSKADLEILFLFPKKEMNIKVGENFVPYNQDTEFALFGVRTWEIWCRQERAANQENLDEANFMETSSLLSQGRSRARQGGALPKAPQGHKYTPLGAQGGVIHPSIHRNSAKPRRER
jgi:hypothetical protein